MPAFLTRLWTAAVVRLNHKPYLVEGEPKSFVFNLPGATVAVMDRFIPLGDEHIPSGLLLQVQLDADAIDEAVSKSRGAAVHVLNLISLVSAASIPLPMPIWAYDATPDVEDREFRFFAYDPHLGLQSRQVNQSWLSEVWRQSGDGFFGRPEIKDDWKERVLRAISAYRRGLADNDDVLTEFLTAWASLEGLDCVYRGIYPSRQANLMDGARAVFQRLGQPDDLFESLKGLRNGLAHGYVSLVDAVRIASNNIELVRKTLVVMILRILKCDEKIIAQVADQIAYKGKFAPYYKHVGTIRLRPGSVSDFENQPLIEMQCDAVHTERAGDKLNFSPTLNFTLKKGDSLNGRGYEIWGDVAGGLTIEGPTEVNVVSGSENKRSNPGIRT